MAAQARARKDGTAGRSATSATKAIRMSHRSRGMICATAATTQSSKTLTVRRNDFCDTLMAMTLEEGQPSEERVGLKVVAVTAVVLAVLFGLYWGGKKLLLPPATSPEQAAPDAGVTVAVKRCDNQTVYRSLDEALGEAGRACILDLSNQNLTDLPYTIYSLSNLTTLYLQNNQLTSLTPYIGYLTNLQILDVSNNKLSDVPAQLGLLTVMRELNLSNNQLTEFPIWISYMKQLERLNLRGNQIPAITGYVGNIPSVRVFDASDNRIDSIAPQIGYLSRLEQFDLRNNQLTALPDHMSLLKSLREVNLGGNPLAEEALNRLKAQVPQATVTF